MKIEKIYALKHTFTEGSEPTESLTLGIKSPDCDLILGSFYYGPGMAKDTDVECEKLESLIDYIVLHCEKGG